MKKDGKLIIRDWVNKNSDIPYTLHEKVSKEVDRWKKLKENSIIQNVTKMDAKEY